MQTTVVLGFFAPIRYRLPVQHLHTVVEALRKEECEVVVVQAVFPGNFPQEFASDVVQINYPTQSLLFHKERLWNIGARASQGEQLIFLDADLIFETKDWLRQCQTAFQHADIIQPFSRATWLGKTGQPEMTRKAAAFAIGNELRPCFAGYHAGFGWGMTRQAFNHMGGFFDCSIAGNSDSFFTLSLRDNVGHTLHEKYFENMQDKTILCESYRSYKRRAVAKNFRVAAPDDVHVLHLWHGSRANRQYITRTKMFPTRADGEFAIHDDKNGLQAWDNERQANESVQHYFVNKRDDG